MGWYPQVIENSLEENLTDEFWEDLYKCLVKFKEEKVSLPDNFWDFNAYVGGDLEELKYSAFDSDHMEHIASWLWDKKMWPLFLNHTINGKFILHHQEGGGWYQGIEFIDGVPHEVQVDVEFYTGKPLE